MSTRVITTKSRPAIDKEQTKVATGVPVSVESVYRPVNVPSLGVFYTPTLQVRQFRREEVLKIFDAKQTKSTRMFAEAIGATLGPDMPAIWELTVGDYWYLLYWHQLNSYPKNPRIINWSCNSPEHFKLIGKKTATVGSLQQTTTLRKESLNVVNIDGHEAALEAFHAATGLTGTSMRVGDYVRLSDMEVENENGQEHKGSELLMLRYAACLDHRVHGGLDARIKAMETVDYDLWPEFEKLASALDHGVAEKLTLKCDTCEVEAQREVALDALTFLP